MKFLKESSTTYIKLGKWNYYPGQGRFQNGTLNEFFLERRLTKLFDLLLEEKNEIVNRAELMRRVWEDVRVTKESVTKGVFDLRKIIKEKEISSISISTIRNVGYRLEIEKSSTKNGMLWPFLLKSAVYIFLALSFVILLIRALRYEQ